MSKDLKELEAFKATLPGVNLTLIKSGCGRGMQHKIYNSFRDAIPLRQHRQHAACNLTGLQLIYYCNFQSGDMLLVACYILC